MDAQSEARIAQLRSQGHLYDHLAKSIAPEIYGHDDVKRIRNITNASPPSCIFGGIPVSCITL